MSNSNVLILNSQAKKKMNKRETFTFKIIYLGVICKVTRNVFPSL